MSIIIYRFSINFICFTKNEPTDIPSAHLLFRFFDCFDDGIDRVRIDGLHQTIVIGLGNLGVNGQSCQHRQTQVLGDLVQVAFSKDLAALENIIRKALVPAHWQNGR